VADDAGELPGAAVVLPQHDEPGGAARARVAPGGLARITEHVAADLDRPVCAQRVDLERTGHEVAVHLAADVVPERLDERRTASTQAGFVVVELEVIGDDGSERVQVAA